MIAVLVLTSVLGLVAVLSGGSVLFVTLRQPPIAPEALAIATSNQILIIAGAMLIAISVGFLAVIKQLRTPPT